MQILGKKLIPIKEYEDLIEENISLKNSNKNFEAKYETEKIKTKISGTIASLNDTVSDLEKQKKYLIDEVDALIKRKTKEYEKVLNQKTQEREIKGRIKDALEQEDAVRKKQDEQKESIEKKQAELDKSLEEVTAKTEKEEKLKAAVEEKLKVLTKKHKDITDFEELELQKINLEQYVDDAEAKKNKLDKQVRGLESKRGELGVITALEFELQEGSVSKNWVFLFETIYNSETFKNRKKKLVLHLASRLSESNKEKFKALEKPALVESEFNADEDLLLFEIYRLGLADNDAEQSIMKISELLEDLCGEFDFNLSHRSEIQI